MSYAQPSYLTTNSMPFERSDRFSIGTLVAYGLGIAASIPLQAVGRLYVGEIMLAVIAVYGWFQLLSAPPKYRNLVFGFQAMMALSLLGYIGSDLYREVPVIDYLRGWSRWCVMLTNFVALSWLATKHWGHFWRFVIGWQVGHALLPFVQGFASYDYRFLYKFYYAYPLLFLMLFLMRKRSPKTLAILLVGFGVLSVAIDYRSIALMCWLTAAITILSERRRAQIALKIRTSTIIKAVIAVLVVASLAVWAVQLLGERYGYSERFYRSNMKRLTFARVTWEGIRQSPMIGYGSWAKNAELRKIRDKIIKKTGQDRVYRVEQDEDLVIAHSQVLQGWLEGGLLGALFFFFFGYQLCKKLLYLIAERPYVVYMPLTAFVCINASWHLLFSPYKGSQRMYIAIASVCICYLGQEIATSRQVKQFYQAYAFNRQPTR